MPHKTRPRCALFTRRMNTIAMRWRTVMRAAPSFDGTTLQQPRNVLPRQVRCILLSTRLHTETARKKWRKSGEQLPRHYFHYASRSPWLPVLSLRHRQCAAQRRAAPSSAFRRGAIRAAAVDIGQREMQKFYITSASAFYDSSAHA